MNNNSLKISTGFSLLKNKKPCPKSNNSVKIIPNKNANNPIFTVKLSIVNFLICNNIRNIKTLIKANVNKCRYPIIKKFFKAIDFSTMYGNDDKI